MWPTGSLPERLGMPAAAPYPPGGLGRRVPLDVQPRRAPHACTALAPRESIQMMEGPMARPSAPTATVPDHCAVHPTPTIFSGGTPLSATARRAAATMARHHCSGSCSAAPSAPSTSGTASNACAAMRTGGRDDRDLGPARSEIDGQDIASSAAATAERCPAGDVAATAGRLGPGFVRIAAKRTAVLYARPGPCLVALTPPGRLLLPARS